MPLLWQALHRGIACLSPNGSYAASAGPNAVAWDTGAAPLIAFRAKSQKPPGRPLWSDFFEPCHRSECVFHAALRLSCAIDVCGHVCGNLCGMVAADMRRVCGAAYMKFGCRKIDPLFRQSSKLVSLLAPGQGHADGCWMGLKRQITFAVSVQTVLQKQCHHFAQRGFELHCHAAQLVMQRDWQAIGDGGVGLLLTW